MSLLFLSNSLLTTVQDLGRTGYASFGVNQNGAMDKKAARLINTLLGNDENEAVLEMHFPAPKILFESDVYIALGGANFEANIEGKILENWRVYLVKKGQTLNFSNKISGNRIYLSVKGGFEVEDWLGSKSTNLKAMRGGFEGRPLHKDDRVELKSGNQRLGSKLNYKISPSLIHVYSKFPTVRVIKGAEWERLTEKSCNKFLSGKFTIALNSDRMGFRLDGEPLDLSQEFDLVSSAVNFGTIQLLPSGQMIVLMADHQTTGGYPRIAHIISEDLPLVAQLGANDSLGFGLASIEEAESLALEFEKNLNFLKTAVRFR